MDAIHSKRIQSIPVYIDMKRARYGSMPVPMPDIPSNVGGLGRFASQVRNAIKALRDRPVLLPSAPAVFNAHPWKVTSNGDDTVRVAEGRAHHWKIGESDEGAALDNPVSFAGQSSLSVTTSGTSYIYAKMPIASAQVAGGTSNRQLTGTVTVENETDLPTAIDAANDVYLLLATVEKTDGIVAITEQHLSHNPVVSIQDSEGAAASTHPWKATANGDDTVNVNSGSIIYVEGTGSSNAPNSPFDGSHVSYTSSNITITASGTLYAVIDFDSNSDDIASLDYFAGLSILTCTPTSVTVELNPTLSSDQISLPIADVTLSGGVATVTSQILDCNPPLTLNYAVVGP